MHGRDMSRSDLISLLGAIVAAIAVVVSAIISLIAVRIQRYQSQLERAQAKKDADKQADEVARGLAHQLAQLFQLRPGAGAEAATIQAEFEGLVLAANDLVGEGNANWYLHYNLALAYTWRWETDKADLNWRKALEKADDSVRTRTTVLMGMAAYHYSLGAIAAGRTCFAEAEKLAQTGPSDDIIANQVTVVLTELATQEYGAGELGASARAYAKAWQLCKNVHLQWRREAASNNLVYSLFFTFGQAPEGLPNTLPGDLIAFAISVQQQQMLALQQQGQSPFAMQQPLPPGLQNLASKGGEPAWPPAGPPSGHRP
jgi:hypothetical protein